MSSSSNEWEDLLRETEGQDVATALATLKRISASPAGAIWFLRQRHPLSLAEVKQALDRHPDWKAQAEAADKMHEEILRAQEEEKHLSPEHLRKKQIFTVPCCAEGSAASRGEGSSCEA